MLQKKNDHEILIRTEMCAEKKQISEEKKKTFNESKERKGKVSIIGVVLRRRSVEKWVKSSDWPTHSG